MRGLSQLGAIFFIIGVHSADPGVVHIFGVSNLQFRFVNSEIFNGSFERLVSPIGFSDIRIDSFK